MLFDRSVRGLVAGAPVDLLGLELGTVRQIALPYDVRSGHFAVEVTVEVFPMRLASFASDAGPEVVPDKRLLEAVGRQRAPRAAAHRQPADRAALRRARLRAQGLLGDDRHRRPAAHPADRARHAERPAAAAGRRHRAYRQGAVRPHRRPAAGHAGGCRGRDQEPHRTLESARGAIEQLSPEASAALGDVRRTLASAQSSLEGLERHVARPGAPLQRHANDALVELRRAAQALRVLSEYLQRHPQALLRGRADDPAPLPFPSTGAPDARATPGEPAAAEEEPVSR
jgi:paraquat-inducible protein B